MKFQSMFEAAGLLFFASGISTIASPVEGAKDGLEDSVGTSVFTPTSLLFTD